jgi:hypothetical protein
MSEWWTYRLTSFLLFSPRTYYRLLELYNLAIWPAQLAGMAIGLAIVALLIGKRGHRDRIIAGLLAACWLWVAWAFHYQRYAQINWVAPWFAAAFAFQALLLVVVGVLAGRLVLQPASEGKLWIATSMVAISVLGYPLLAPLTERSWTTAETFGAAADPTAIATIAALALVRGRIRWLLLVVPLLWCAVAGATLWAMKEPQGLVVVAAALLALWPAMPGTRHGASDADRLPGADEP